MKLVPRKGRIAACATLAITLLLAACGGGGGDTGPASGPTRLLAGTTAVAADYRNSVQQIYVAYFGRPADAGGLASFQSQLAAAGAPVDLQQLSAAYKTSAVIRALVDSFAVSDESKALYSGDTRTFVTAIYTNVLNRAPDQGGLDFWVDAIDNQGLNRANASLSIMAGALVNSTTQGQADGRVITNKVAIASSFTVAVPDTAYRGDAAAAKARAMLALINESTTLQAFQATLDSTVKSMADAAPSIYAGTYNGTYNGSDSGSFSFTVAPNGTMSGSGLSSIYGTQLVITGTLGTASTSPLPVTGFIGPFSFTATIDAATGKVVGQYSGNGVSGNITAQRAP